MTAPVVLNPASGSRIVRDGKDVILFGQPPEVLKSLLLNGITEFNGLVLTDIKEKDGSLMNNLEFPFYFFLFVAKGLEQGRKINLIGSDRDIKLALRLLRLTLMGPTRDELDRWTTAPEQREEWLAVSEALALKDDNGETIPLTSFFNLIPFESGVAQMGGLTITHQNLDRYEISNRTDAVVVDLSADENIQPPYNMQLDYVPGGLVKLGLEILGGASGFTPTEPCTGLALCYNGDYILIDAMPFLDQHLFARGISKNQISALFLTHLHDDHCAMFPLMMMPHRVDVITTREIFHMAMEKLALNLGWKSEVITEHFNLVEITPGKITNYYGLSIEPHVTVHSIPTIGATFFTDYKGTLRKLCIVGDNHSMTAIRQMHSAGSVSDTTRERLEDLYTMSCNLLVADGGAGAIHGDPADALISNADRVLFVHVEQLPHEFDTTFSLASAGKRYTIIEGDSSIYTSQVSHYLTMWLGEPLPNRWMRSLLAAEDIIRYNTDDVVIVQESDTRGLVYLILTGYCDVVHHDGRNLHTVAKLQAGDILGEMAIVTGRGTRNASVVARTPVTVCVFAEETFGAFINSQGFKEVLIDRWSIRPVIKSLPQFSSLSSTVIEAIGKKATLMDISRGAAVRITTGSWMILADGQGNLEGETINRGGEMGNRPLGAAVTGEFIAQADCQLVKFDSDDLRSMLLGIPLFNYTLRKQRILDHDEAVDWMMPSAEI